MVTKIEVNGNYFLTDDGSKLILKKLDDTSRLPTKLEVYSNKQIWAVSGSDTHSCLYVDDKEHLNHLDGLDVKLAADESGMTCFE